jgi:aminoglycoside phosphotransferase
LIGATLASDHPLMRAIGRLENERFMARIRRVAPQIVATIPSAVLDGGAVVTDLRRMPTGVAIGTIRRAGLPLAMIVLPQSAPAVVRLERQANVERTLRATRGLEAWSHLIPEPIHDGDLRGQRYFVNRLLPGEPAATVIRDVPRREALMQRAARVVAELHDVTAERRTLDEELLRSWIDDPAAAVRRVLASRREGSESLDRLDRLVAELRGALEGVELGVGWIHGDYWLGNVLIDAEGEITGIIDWDRAAAAHPRTHDLLHLLIYTRKLLEDIEPGEIIRRLLNGEAWTPAEASILEVPENDLGRSGRERVGLLLYWLRFVAQTFEQSDYFSRHPQWIRENVQLVLAAV